jgi:hypothetical protein
MKISTQIRTVVKQIIDSPMNVYNLGEIRDQVIYIPTHLLNKFKDPKNWGYPNGIQPGFIYGNMIQGSYPVRYWQWDGIAKTYLPELRTLANSELTPSSHLFYFRLFSKETVFEAVRSIITQRS